jgi:hypothetical protein
MSAVLDTTTSAELAPQGNAAVMPSFHSSSGWELAQRIGKAFAASDLVPQQYKGNLANCIVALEMANRMGASPLQVMQNLYIVHGNPGWSSKFLIATFNQSGKFSALRYRWNAEHTACRAWAVEKATGEELVGPEVSIQMAKEEGWSTKNGSKWKTMPELMLMYRSAAFFVRTYAPEISMGLRTDDELIDTVEDVRPASSINAVRGVLGHVDGATGEIHSDSPAAGQNAGNGGTVQSYASVADKISKATTADALDYARSLIAEVPNVEQQAELHALASKQFATIGE